MIGSITLWNAGRNGIMLVSDIKHVQKKEAITDLREAMPKGASERLTRTLMTALCAGLALIPVALGQGKPAAKFRRRWRWSSCLACYLPWLLTWWSSRQCIFA
jgi:multidrug efflux pump subunit AcrB